MNWEEGLTTSAAILLLGTTLYFVADSQKHGVKADSAKNKRSVAELRVKELERKKATLDDSIEKARKGVNAPNISATKPSNDASGNSSNSPSSKPAKKDYSNSSCQGVKGLDNLDKLSPEKLYQLARGYFHGSSKFAGCPQDYDVAARLFTLQAQKFPNDDKAPYSLFNIGFAYNRAGKHCEAQKAFEHVYKKHPKHKVSRWRSKHKHSKRLCKK